MKALLLLLFFVALLTGSARAQGQRVLEQKRVNQVVIQLFNGVASLNESQIKQHVTKDFILLEDGQIWNTDTLMSKLAPLKGIAFKRINKLTFIRTDVSGNSAWTAYDNVADMVVNGQAMSRHWLESAFLVRQGNGWRVKLLHSTPVK